LYNLEELYLSSTDIEDISPLSELTNLMVLNLDRTRVSDVSALRNITNLRRLSLNNTYVCDISSLCALDNLEYINLSNTKVTNISPLQNLCNLKEVVLDATRISDIQLLSSLLELRTLELNFVQSVDVLALKDLSNLRSLGLSETTIINAPLLSQLQNLEELRLTHCKGVDIDALSLMTSLRKLYLGKTQVSNVEALSSLINLEVLSLWGNKITDIEKLSTLEKLQDFDLEATCIHKLPNWLGDLKNLKILDLRHLDLHSIPQNFLQMNLPFVFESPYWGDGILLDETMLRTQPISLFMQPREMIQAYYDSEKVPINEAKVIFLGDGGAGKTHTIKRLLNDGKKDNYETETTPGIDITNYWAEKDERQFNIHFWDFGGQEIMHAMHRCFLTERTCYVVILSNRADGDLTARARYWLKNIQSFAPGARVLIAVNRWDNIQSGGLDMNRLIQEYKNLCDSPVHYSAKNSNDEDFSVLTNAIIREASKLDSTAMYFPVQWAIIRQELLNIAQERHYIDKHEYHDICEKQGLTSADIRTWLLEWFNDLGVCFSYHQDKENTEKPVELDSYKVLNPQWLTNAIYILINHGKYYAENGKLHMNTIRNLLQDPNLGVLKGVTYTDQERDYVLDVMRKFKLSYSVSATHEFVPALCEPNTPQQLHPQGYPYQISYQMKYTYLPDSVVHQLMIRSYRHLNPEKIWRKGMRLDIDWIGLSAVVDMGSDDSTLRIDVYSMGTVEPWKLLNNIRNDLASINSDLGLKAKDEIIIHDGDVDINKSVKELLSAKEQGRKTLSIYNEITEIIKDYSVDEILGITFGKETMAEVQKQAEENEQTFSQAFTNCKIGTVNLYQQAPAQICPEATEIIKYLVRQQSRINEKVLTCLLNELEKSEDGESKKLLSEIKTGPKKGILQKLDDFFKRTVSIAENGEKTYNAGKGVVKAIMAAWPVIAAETPGIVEYFASFMG